MGLFSGGNSSSQQVTNTTNYSNNPTVQDDQSGSVGASNFQFSPTLQGSSTGTFTTTNSSFFAPVNNTPSINYGDAAVQSGQATAQSSIGGFLSSLVPKTASTSTSGASGSPSWLTTLFSAPDIYWLVGGVVLLMLFRGHHR